MKFISSNNFSIDNSYIGKPINTNNKSIGKIIDVNDDIITYEIDDENSLEIIKNQSVGFTIDIPMEHIDLNYVINGDD